MFSDRVNPFEPIKNRQDLGQNQSETDQSTARFKFTPAARTDNLSAGFFSTLTNLDTTIDAKDLDFKFIVKYTVQTALSKFIPSIPPVFSTQENQFTTRNEIKSNFNKLM